MHRLICTFIVCIWHKTCFRMTWPIWILEQIPFVQAIIRNIDDNNFFTVLLWDYHFTVTVGCTVFTDFFILSRKFYYVLTRINNCVALLVFLALFLIILYVKKLNVVAFNIFFWPSEICFRVPWYAIKTVNKQRLKLALSRGKWPWHCAVIGP